MRHQCITFTWCSFVCVFCVTKRCVCMCRAPVWSFCLDTEYWKPSTLPARTMWVPPNTNIYRMTTYMCSIPVPVSTTLCMDSKVVKSGEVPSPSPPIQFSTEHSLYDCMFVRDSECGIHMCWSYYHITQCVIWQYWSLLYSTLWP